MRDEVKGKKCAVCGKPATHVMGEERKPVCPQHGIETIKPILTRLRRP